MNCSGRHSYPQEEGGETQEDRDGLGYGRDTQGGDQGVQGDSHVSVLQGGILPPAS